MKRIFLLLLCMQCTFSFCLPIFAQPPGEAFKKLAALPLQSPQAASFSKYVEYPVSYYSGLAQISIPIYEIVSGDISVPISLSYHGSGIRVQEEASWVGLGWTLNAGGVITHAVKGVDDDASGGHTFNQVYPNGQLNTYVEAPMVIGKTGCQGLYTGSASIWNCAELASLTNIYHTDGEHDLYAYNFGNYSGKFFSGNGQFVDVSQNNILFTQLGGNGFTAVAPDGFKYEFMAVEKAWSYPTTYATRTAFYLTKITSPKGKTVTFQYKSFKQLVDAGGSSWSNQFPNLSLAWGPEETVMTFPALTESFATYEYINGDVTWTSVPSSAYGIHKTYSSTTSTNLYLEKIIFDLGWVDFITSPRSDLYGVKLDAINISRGPLVKSIPFTYDYFVSSTGFDDMYDPVKLGPYLDASDGHVSAYPSSYRNRRLKLLSVAVEPSPHNFEYYEGNANSMLPYKTSFAQDYWGFYNGRHGNPSLIPDYDIYSQQKNVPVQLSSWQGANRNPDDDFIRAGSLKRIVYPTGGFSQFTYEMNTFQNLSPEQLYTYRYVTHGGIDASGTGNKKFYFTIATNTYSDIYGGLYCNEMMDMNSPSYNCGCGYFCSGGSNEALFAVIEKVDPNTHAVIQAYPQWQFDISKDEVRNAGGNIYKTNQLIEPGTYCITANYPDSHNPPGNIPYNRRAELFVSFYEQVPNQNNSVASGGGLRIGSIKNFDPVGMQLLERKFTYSGGKIMRYPVFNADARQQYTHYWCPPDGPCNLFKTNYRFYYLYATPAFPLSTSANGSLVGYDMVTESVTGTTSIGKTQYEYKNRADMASSQPDVYMPGTPTTGFLDNGFLNRVAVYDKNNILVKETLNSQVTVLAATYWPFKCRWFQDCSEYPYCDYDNLVEFSFYPLQVGKILNATTTLKDYANGTTISNTIQNAYNSKGLQSQQTSTSSDGSTLTTNYNYASDYTGVSSGWIQDLKDQNMISIPLEIYHKRNGLVAGGSFTTYLKHDNIITPDKIYEIETAAPQAISSTVPNGTIPAELKLTGTLTYSASGNLVQTKAEDDIYTSYLWGYNEAYPVAKVVGTEYSTINNLLNNWTVNPSILANPYVSDASMRQELTNLRNALAGTKASITSYTYAPLIGMTSQTDEKGLTTYYSFDNYNRLSMIKDHQSNILKQYDYNYALDLKNVANNLVYNQEITRIFNKSCSPNQYGYIQISNDVPYTVPAGKYVGLTQQAADDAAMEEINANGQANANLMADCYVYGGPLEINSIENGSGTNVTIRYKCPFFANYYCFLFIQDMSNGTYIGGGPISVSQGQTIYTATNVPKNKQYKFWLQAQGSSYYNTSPDTIVFLQ